MEVRWKKRYQERLAIAAICVVLVTGLIVNPASVASSVVVSTGMPRYIDEFDVPTMSSGPLAIAVDKLGIVWFTESNASKLGWYNPENYSFREYQVPGGGSMWGLAVEEDGYVWFTQYLTKESVSPNGTFVFGGHGRLGRLNIANGNFTFVDIPTPSSLPMRLILDKRGRVWFTELFGNKIGVYDQLSSLLTEYKVPTNSSGPADLFFDKHGILWFGESYAQKVAKFSPENQSFIEYSVGPSIFSPVGIAVDEGGNVWLADHGGSWIAEFNPNTGELTRYSTHLPLEHVSYLSIPNGLLIDHHGRIWFSEHGGNSIAYFDPQTQSMVEFPIPTGPISTAFWIALAPDGNIWFTEWYTNKIGVVHSDLPVPISFNVPQSQLQLQAGEQANLSLQMRTSAEIRGNGTFRYSWTSYNRTEISVAFMPRNTDLSSASIRVEISLPGSIPPGNYTLGLGMDVGTLLVWSFVHIRVVPPTRQSSIGDTVLVTSIFLSVVVLSVLYVRRRTQRTASAA